MYYWDRLDAKTHVVIGWLYAAAAWISLVLITGITAFMLNPGVWATDPPSQNFWRAFFNPQFLPQTVARTGGALLLSSLYVYLHASLALGDARLRDMIAARSARPALLGRGARDRRRNRLALFSSPFSRGCTGGRVGAERVDGADFALTVVVFFLLYFGPYRNPGWLSPGFAGSLCLFGIAAFATGEFIREAVRKPFVVYNVVYGDQLLPQDVPKFRSAGCFESGVWTHAHVAQQYPQTIVDGRVDGKRLLALPPKDRIALGEVLFQYHCNDCHASTPAIRPWDPCCRDGRAR